MKNVNVFAPDGLVARKEGSAWTYYTFDPQGNVLNKLDASEGVTAGRLLDAWGQGVETTLPRNIDPWGYNAKWGYYYDRETALYLCQHRMYDASAGRWLNRDPIGIAGGMNLYGYCAGGPVGAADPRGLIVGVDDAVLILAATALVAAVAAWGAQPEVQDSLRQSVSEISDGVREWRWPIVVNCEPVDVIKPGKTGAPGSTEIGWNTSRRYGPLGYPQVDRDWDPTHENPDHSHDWIPDPNGGFPTRERKGRAPQPGDPPRPRNAPPNHEPSALLYDPSSMGGEVLPGRGIRYR